MDNVALSGWGLLSMQSSQIIKEVISGLSDVPASCKMYIRDGSAMVPVGAATLRQTQLADKTYCLTQSQHADTGPTSPSTKPVTPIAWHGSH